MAQDTGLLRMRFETSVAEIATIVASLVVWYGTYGYQWDLQTWIQVATSNLTDGPLLSSGILSVLLKIAYQHTYILLFGPTDKSL